MLALRVPVSGQGILRSERENLNDHSQHFITQ